MSVSLSRRNFLKLAGAASVATALGGGVSIFAPTPVYAAPEGEDLLYGVCGMCGMGCAYIAHLHDGRVVRLSGNPKDQIAEGKLCVKGYSGIRLLYDPDRLKCPMKRTNPEKGIGVDPGWVKISWDEAIGLTASNLKEVRDIYGPQSIMVVSMAKPWQKHFAKAIGTPNLVSHHDTCVASQVMAWLATVGCMAWTTDFEHCKYILCFGWDGMGKAKNHWGRSVNNALANGTKLVVFDPRLSITAARAGEWIPIKPGTDLAVLLAMIRTIINEDLYDHEFVENYTHGFDRLDEMAQEYTPEWAASISNVPAETIARIAREFAATKPAVIASHKRDAGGPNYANSWRTARCFLILNALVGSIDRPGGRILDRKPALPGLWDVFEVPPYPDTVKGPRVDGLENAPLLYKVNMGSFSTLAEGILSGQPNPIKAAVFWHHNVLAFPNPQRMVEALKTLDFVAVSDIMPTEIVQLADMVLPEGTYFEGSGLVARAYHAMYPQVALKEPLPALYETRGFGSVAVAILRAMGLNEYAPEGMGGGPIMEADLEALGTSVAEIQGNGGLWGEPVEFKPKTEFKTSSKKIELYSTALEKNGYDPLPHWQPPRAKLTNEYPLHLLIYRKPWERLTQNQNDPILAEFSPENEVMVHPDAASKLGIANGDYVWIESELGKIKVKAHLTQGIRPDCIAVDHGFGHWSKGLSVAYGRGANDGDLVPGATIDQKLEFKDPSMSTYWEDMAVKVYK